MVAYHVFSTDIVSLSNLVRFLIRGLSFIFIVLEIVLNNLFFFEFLYISSLVSEGVGYTHDEKDIIWQIISKSFIMQHQ